MFTKWCDKRILIKPSCSFSHGLEVLIITLDDGLASKDILVIEWNLIGRFERLGSGCFGRHVYDALIERFG